MKFINPIEILELQNYSISDIESSMIKKAKRKLFADIDLSDNGLLDYKGVSLTKSDCDVAINSLEYRETAKFYLFLAKNNQPLNDFLVNGNEKFFTNFSQESIYKLPSFINFISPYFSVQFDRALLKAINLYNYSNPFNVIALLTTDQILKTLCLIATPDINTAFRSVSIEITNRIYKIEKITREIKNKTTSYSNDDIDEIVCLVGDLFPNYFLNELPPYFQSQINKTAAAINQLQLAIWDNLHNTSVCRELLEHLLSLNTESVNKQTYEKNYKIVKTADEKEKVQDKIQNQINKLIALINSFESKPKTVANGRELINHAKQYLFNLKAIPQENDNIYISLSTRIAFFAQDLAIEEVNKKQSSVTSTQDIIGYYRFKSILKNAWEVTQLIGSLDLQEDFRTNHYNPKKNILLNICSKASVATPQTVLTKIPKCKFLIINSTLKHTDKNGKLLPITYPFIRGDVRYIGLNLIIEAFGNQSVKFCLKYIQPNGTIKTGTSSPAGFTFSKDVTINPNTKVINLSGWGNGDTGTYIVGTHSIEVWIDNCMIYRKSFVIDWSQAEKKEYARQEAERREHERIEVEKRKEQARIEEKKAIEKKVRSTCIWIMGFFIALAVIFSIWGIPGLEFFGGTVFFIVLLGIFSLIPKLIK